MNQLLFSLTQKVEGVHIVIFQKALSNLELFRTFTYQFDTDFRETSPVFNRIPAVDQLRQCNLD